MLCYYLGESITNYIYPYLSWDTMYYHRVPTDIWRTYCRRLGFDRRDDKKSPKERFFYSLFYELPPRDYRESTFLYNIFGKMHYQGRSKRIPSHLFTNKFFIMFCLRHVDVGILERVPQAIINKHFMSFVSINPRTIYYLQPSLLTRQLVLDAFKINPSTICYTPEVYRRDLEIMVEICSDPDWISNFEACHSDVTCKMYIIFKALCQKGKFAVLAYIIQNGYNMICEGYGAPHSGYSGCWMGEDYDDYFEPVDIDDEFAIPLVLENSVNIEIFEQYEAETCKLMCKSRLKEESLSDEIPEEIHTHDDDDYYHTFILKANLIGSSHQSVYFRVY